MACSQFFHWQIMRGDGTAAHLEAVSVDLQNENSALLAQKNRLLSTSHVQALAAARLALHEPGKGQVHRL